jgi:glycosyltransferase involved in cell wall biosynthesis/peptidoglycan/xylan/chitin deacetylase (PgdA/CDA1 family)
MRPIRKVRVLMLLENNPYPQDDRVRREAETLAAAGYHVRLICPARKDQQNYETINGVEVYRYPAPLSGRGFGGYVAEYGYAMAASLVISWIIFLRHGFDIIHAANPPDTFAFIGMFYKCLGKQFIYDHHDLAPEMYLARFKGAGSKVVFHALVGLERLACKMADRIIATNESYKAMEMERAGVPPERIKVIRNGPDLTRFNKIDPAERSSSKDRTILGYVGVTGFQDGLDYLLRSIRHLRYTLGRTDFTCIIIGAGDALPSLQSLSRDLKVSDVVQFLGWIEPDQVAQYLSGADICVAPEPSNAYTDRSTTIKLMEYMALSKPIVAFDLPEHRVTAGAGAVYVADNDELSFAKAIAELMNNSERRQIMGSIGRDRVENELAWCHCAPHLLAVYKKLSVRHSSTATRLERLRYWLNKRSTGYLTARLFALIRRYGLSTRKAEQRVRECILFFRGRHCAPTLPTPGRIVEQNAEFCREIQTLGAELAVHGYDHVDFLGLSDGEAKCQLGQAAAAFHSAGIKFSGVRCPYLSYSDRLNELLPERKFEYSSNKAILWNVVPQRRQSTATQVFANLESFYRPKSAESTVSMPSLVADVVEIPVSLPDDLQLYHGLKLRDRDLAQPWVDILRHTHQTGQLFVLMFHPELFQDCKSGFEFLLNEASKLKPAVWLTQLHEINSWWREKAQFGVRRLGSNGRLRLKFECSERATVIFRGLATEMPTSPWCDNYCRLQGRTLSIVNSELPFVGLDSTAPRTVSSFLEQQGYIIDQSVNAAHCSIYLDSETLTMLDNERKLVQHIESSAAPLVRFWPWPNGNKSALSITGDLDALSLFDYTARLFR